MIFCEILDRPLDHLVGMFLLGTEATLRSSNIAMDAMEKKKHVKCADDWIWLTYRKHS